MVAMHSQHRALSLHWLHVQVDGPIVWPYAGPTGEVDADSPAEQESSTRSFISYSKKLFGTRSFNMIQQLLHALDTQAFFS